MARRRKRQAYVLSDNEVREIRRRYKDGESVRSIAKRLGVSSSQVHRIVTGQARRDVE